ncbi:MAG: ethanolamine ammonia-lyase reactivating factor EutA [Candidatus Hodarchaeales archaeon]|jgi:ethanolamine utilization protein EutA
MSFIDQTIQFFFLTTEIYLLAHFGADPGKKIAEKFKDCFIRLFDKNQHLMPDDLAKQHGINPVFVMALAEALEESDPLLEKLEEHVLELYRTILTQAGVIATYLTALESSTDPWKELVKFTKAGNRRLYDNDYFRVKTVVENENHFGFDINRCLMFEILQKNGHPELGPLLCKYDYILTDKISKWASFERKETIADGHSRCDFRYTRKEIAFSEESLFKRVALFFKYMNKHSKPIDKIKLTELGLTEQEINDWIDFIIFIQSQPKIEIQGKYDHSTRFSEGQAGFTEQDVDYLKVLSVGIDVGSSTSHLVFSNIALRREQSFFNMSNRFIPVSREVIYEGDIIFTPLLDKNTIDIEAVVNFIQEEYKNANIAPRIVNTGAVIVTGEASKKQNAAEIVNRIAVETGKFVSATAGPNFEALLAAKGSGIISRSDKLQNTILNVDIGGGTSKLAIISKGKVTSTASISVGAQLLGINDNFKIWRIDDPTRLLMQELNMNYQIGDIIPKEAVEIIARKFVESLFEVMMASATSDITKKLLVTNDLDFPEKIDEYSFSGGVAEMIYGDDTEYDDIGQYLAKEINIRIKELDLQVVEPENKIRATVIGAGAFSVSISGSTCYVDKNMKLPLLNVPVIPVDVTSENFSLQKVEEEISRAYQNFDLIEGEDEVALYFKQPISTLKISASEKLSEFAKAIEKSLQNSVAGKKKIILLFEMDIAKILGIIIKRETAIRENLICLDELYLESGDWIDIGTPLREGQVFPVTVKSLVFKG